MRNYNPLGVYFVRIPKLNRGELKMSEEKQLQLGMTPQEVAEILGKPEEIKKTGWKAVACLYTGMQDGEEISIKIRFVDTEYFRVNLI